MIENLRTHCHQSVLDLRQHTHGRSAVALQKTKKFALGAQTQQRLRVIQFFQQRPRFPVLSPYLQGNDSLSARRQKYLLGRTVACKSSPSNRTRPAHNRSPIARGQPARELLRSMRSLHDLRNRVGTFPRRSTT